MIVEENSNIYDYKYTAGRSVYHLYERHAQC